MLQLPSLIPPIAFFVIANFLAIFAILDTAYVAHLFQRGNLQRLWPVKVLRFLVAGINEVFLVMLSCDLKTAFRPRNNLLYKYARMAPPSQRL